MTTSSEVHWGWLVPGHGEDELCVAFMALLAAVLMVWIRFFERAWTARKLGGSVDRVLQVHPLRRTPAEFAALRLGGGSGYPSYAEVHYPTVRKRWEFQL